MIGFLWRASRGYRLRPWSHPYLRWRIETYWGLDADRLTTREFLRFAWQHRGELIRFLRWAEHMEASRRRSAGGRRWAFAPDDAG